MDITWILALVFFALLLLDVLIGAVKLLIKK